MSRVLLVEEDEAFSASLQKILSSVGHQVTLAKDQRSAVSTLRSTIFDIVVCDIGSHALDGIEITKHIKGNFGLPVILLTNLATVLEESEVRALGADAYLAKPFQDEAIIKTISSCLKPSKKPQADEATELEDGLEDDYSKLPIEDMRSEKLANYSVFLRLSPRKFLKIAHRAGDLTAKRIQDLKGKNVEYLFLRGEDFRKYLDFPFEISKSSADTDLTRKGRRIDLLRHTADVFVDQLSKEGLDTEVFDGSVAFVHSTISLLADSSEMSSLLTVLSSHSDSLFGHGVGVSVYSLMLAKVLGWVAPADNLNIAMAGLLHDVGLRDFDRSVLSKPRDQWSEEEVKAYDNHSIKGAEILSQSPVMPEVVIRVVREHHEDCNGKGFPLGLSKIQIHPMSKLIAVANEFCHRVLRVKDQPHVTPARAIADIENTILKKLDPFYFNALKQLVRHV